MTGRIASGVRTVTGDGISIALGTNFPDALAAGAAADRLGGPVLLVTHDTIPVPTREQFNRHGVEHVWLVGGTAVIGDDVFDALPQDQNRPLRRRIRPDACRVHRGRRLLAGGRPGRGEAQA